MIHDVRIIIHDVRIVNVCIINSSLLRLHRHYCDISNTHSMLRGVGWRSQIGGGRKRNWSIPSMRRNKTSEVSNSLGH